jgi:hypothetical protein
MASSPTSIVFRALEAPNSSRPSGRLGGAHAKWKESRAVAAMSQSDAASRLTVGDARSHIAGSVRRYGLDPFEPDGDVPTGKLIRSWKVGNNR